MTYLGKILCYTIIISYYSFGFRKDPFCQNITILWFSLIFLLMAVTQILSCIPNSWKCHKHVVFIIRSCLPVHKSPSSSHMSEMWFNDIDEDCAKLWNSVVVALYSLLQNPQNGEKISYLSYNSENQSIYFCISFSSRLACLPFDGKTLFCRNP